MFLHKKIEIPRRAVFYKKIISRTAVFYKEIISRRAAFRMERAYFLGEQCLEWRERILSRRAVFGKQTVCCFFSFAVSTRVVAVVTVVIVAFNTKQN